MRAFSSLSRFDGRKRIWPWLRTIAEHICIDNQRRGCRIASFEDELDEEPAPRSRPDEVMDAVIRSEGRRKLESALKTLPSRQRRALLLYALEDWDYADIAAAENISLLATKSLIFRARAALRRVCSPADLAPALVPLVAVKRWRLRRAGTNVSRQLARVFELPVQEGIGNFLGALGAMLCLLVSATPPAMHVDARGPAIASKLAGKAVSSEAFGSNQRGRAPGSGEKASTDPLGATKNLADDLVDPTSGATPEDTHFTSFAFSPGYPRDHTVFAAGTVRCYQPACAVLFRSTDSGTTWSRLSDNSFYGGTLLISPAFATDFTLFAMGPYGLQVSRDGGKSFSLATPITGQAAISPSFGQQDQRVLIGTGSIVEYRADLGVVVPSWVPSADFSTPTVVFSPSFARDVTVMVGGSAPNPGGQVWQSVVRRCVASSCQAKPLEGSIGAPAIVPGLNGAWFAFTSDHVYIATDWSAGFRPIADPYRAGEAVSDLLVVPSNETGKYELLVATRSPHGRHSLYRSSDGGLTWMGVGPRLHGMRRGLSRLAASSDGRRLIVASVSTGLACSVDRGATWTRRCASTGD